MSSARISDLAIDLKFRSGGRSEGLSEQITHQIRQAILQGQLKEGDRLPPSRVMASELGVSRGTITISMETLTAEGLLETRIGAGTFVSSHAKFAENIQSADRDDFIYIPSVDQRPDIDRPVEAVIDFRPCRPSLELFPLNIWRRCLSIAGSLRPASDYASAIGNEDLRVEISQYLRRARGLNADPDQILITNGAIHAMSLIGHLFLKTGGTAIVEDPGYPLARQTFAHAGGDILGCDVDSEGLCVGNLPSGRSDVRLVYVTPSHQFPTGQRLSLRRRKALIDWAEPRGVVIVEDDYDGEFRYDVPPLPPMASMSQRCVIYCGTFSKTMFPGLRIGFAVAPRPVIQALSDMRALSEYAPNSIVQNALSHFIREGHYERYIHRMRKLYGSKREALKQFVMNLDNEMRLEGLDSGLNALIRLPTALSAKIASNKAEQRQILMPTIDRYRFQSAHSDDALILGFADCDPARFKKLSPILEAQSLIRS